MKIYSYKKNKLTGDNEVSILEHNGFYTAMTRTDSKDFKTLSNAKKWLEKRGYKEIIDIEELD
jgi:hypothetical protein